MVKLILVCSILFFSNLQAAANPIPGTASITSADASAYTSAVTGDLNNLNVYLQNLGRYFGYDLTQYCSTGGPCSSNSSSGSNYSNLLFNFNETYIAQLNLYNGYLGALLGGGTNNSANSIPLVPTNTPGYSVLNSLAGQTYITPPYSSPSMQNISVSPLIDQKAYQPDPVSQFVLNILATPNISYCYDNNKSKFLTNCPYLVREKIMDNIIGDLPGTQVVFTSNYNQPILPQLNSSVFLTPLLYSNTAVENTEENRNNDENNKGLPALTQAQQAENFIRYISGAVNPVFLPERQAYDNLITKAQNYGNNLSQQEQAQAKATLTNYLISLRAYAAQTSVGIGNLYYMLSRRMPQKVVGSNNSNSTTSEALNEFVMATWRLYNPNTNTSASSATNQWLNKINNGSTATVQKEIAVLLSEINYQLYLTRQQQERLLFTESMILLQNAQLNRPNSSQISSTTNANSPTVSVPSS